MSTMTSEEAKTITTILRHTVLVASLLQRIGHKLEERGMAHDSTKFAGDEFNGFVEINKVAREHEYGSAEYRASLRENEAIPLHYSRHRHHPENHPDGINDMSLIDLIEMVADWKAASEVYGQTSLEESLEIQAKRFKLAPEQVYVVRLIVQELEAA